VIGWTIFDRLYLFNGTVFVVTDEPKKIPDRMLLTSTGYPIKNGPEDVAKRTPTDEDMQIISPERAAELFGSYASRMDGTSVSEEYFVVWIFSNLALSSSSTIHSNCESHHDSSLGNAS